jgi:RNA-directed DNA polymerase
MAPNTTATVRHLQRTLSAKAKQAKEAKFYALDDKGWRRDVLGEAWQQVKANHGAPGVDGQSLEARVAGGQEQEMISRWQEQLRTQTSRCQPVRRVDIPKPTGGTRPLGMATVEDRGVQTAMQLVREPLFEADCHPCAYGYRPKRDAKMASLALKEDLYAHAWGVVDMEVQRDLTTLPHAKLMTFIRQRVVDGRLLRLITQSLKVGVASHGQGEPTTVGVPQGSPLSPRYRHISLNLLDQVGHTRGSPEKLGATLHRYADDALSVCRTSAEQALQAWVAMATRMGFTVNRDKTRLTKRTDGFDFLGCHFVKRRSPTSGKQAISRFPSQAAQRRVRQRLKAFTKRRAPLAPPDFVPQVHQVVRGWVNSSRHTNASQAFRAVQRCINGRFRRYLTCRSTGRGFGWKRSPNRALYAKGLIDIGRRVIRYERAPVHAVE